MFMLLPAGALKRIGELEAEIIRLGGVVPADRLEGQRQIAEGE